MRVSFAYAYSPRENVGSKGRVHAIAAEFLTCGRAIRQEGQALCTTKRFWGLDGRTEQQFEANPCPKCKAMLDRMKARASAPTYPEDFMETH